jgi:hypothetical protein
MKSYAFQSAEITRLWAWLYYSPAKIGKNRTSISPRRPRRFFGLLRVADFVLLGGAVGKKHKSVTDAIWFWANPQKVRTLE